MSTRTRHYRYPHYGRVVALAILLATLVPLEVEAQLIVNDSLSVVPRAITQKFIQDHGPATIRFGKSGYANKIEGRLSSRLGDRDPVEVLFEFLETNRDLFGMTNPREEFRVVKAGELSKRTGIRHLKLVQIYGELDVYGGQLLAHYGRDQTLASVYGTYHPGIDLPTSLRLSLEDALAVIRKDLGTTDSLRVLRNSVFVYVRDGEYYLAYGIVVRPGGDYYIDALTGEILHWFSGRVEAPSPMRETPETPEDTSATPTHPADCRSFVKRSPISGTIPILRTMA